MTDETDDAELDPVVRGYAEKLLADPNTEAIAKSLEMSLEDYVSLVIHYAVTKEDPQLTIAKEEDLAKLGLSTVSADDINKYMEDLASVGQATQGSGFAPAKKPLVASAQLETPNVAADPALKAELERAMRARRGGKS